METYESLECAMFWPTEMGEDQDYWAIRILLPMGRVPVAGVLKFDAVSMDEVLEKTIAVLAKLGYRGKLYINDETWRINYVKIDFRGDTPVVELNEAAIEEGNRQMGLEE